jgi:hypothetical protein
MSRAHLLKLIESALQKSAKSVAGSVATIDKPSVATIDKPSVALIEDDIFMREGWEAVLAKDCVVHVYDGARSFWAAVENNPELLGSWKLIVTDYYFDGEDDTGATVAEQLKGRVTCPILLCSNGQFPPEEMNLFAARIDKDPVGWVDLKPFLKIDSPS